MVDSGIYQIKNTRNGKIYIGSSKDLKKRKAKHYWLLKNNNHHNFRIQLEYNNEIDKSVFVFSVLVICSSEMCLFYEQLCIDAINPDYNSSLRATAPLLNRFGKDHPRTGKKHTAETINKMRKSAKRGRDNHMYGLFGSKHPKFGIRYKNEKQTGMLNPMYQKGHLIQGESNGRCKLSDSQVVDIISSNKSYSTLAKFYGISKSQIAKIKQGKSRKQISGGQIYESRS